jgi:phenylacetate 2-hydroxylase
MVSAACRRKASTLTLADVDHFGPDANKFDPERWLEDTPTGSTFAEKPAAGLSLLSFGGGSRACSGQIMAQRLLYSALIRIISSYRIVASESEPPNTDYIEYNQFKTALVAIPRDFKVKLLPRDKEATEACLTSAKARTSEFYKEK